MRIFVQNNQKVKAGTPLSVIQNPANTQDMLALINMMESWEQSGYPEDKIKSFFTDKFLALGSIQSVYATFLSSLSDYQNYRTLNYYPKKIASQKTTVGNSKRIS